jgi:xanthine dehydrogenase YagT iron-sulfur-binding subunit
MPEQNDEPGTEFSRRKVLRAGGVVVAGTVLFPAVVPPAVAAQQDGITIRSTATITLEVNGQRHRVAVESRVTLLDALRERLALPGTKKGCDRGECGACTVLVDGCRIKSCQTLAIMQEDHKITTIECLARGDELHPVQAAFVRRDALQCGICTPGQVVSAVACIAEGHTGSDDEIREWMSGNLCRCGCYPNIVDAVRDAAEEMRR